MTTPFDHDGGAGPDGTVSGDAVRWVPAQRTPSTLALFPKALGPVGACSRADAIRDGGLVPVPEAMAREAGLRVPVALSAAAYADCVAWSEEDDTRKGTCQDEAGRLWDVLAMTRYAMRRSGRSSRCVVELYRVPRHGPARAARRALLVASMGPGDTGEPVLTVELPDED
ncbi:DUF6573 family protein [Streptomyces specialis]|uniref:DUF6573 family protein n=1 Tax=Streptomyces specialis TaxID=498367 RepID=UPI000B18C58F|nr:DUF6573 family protein [Streptomyces specialis]